MQFAGVNYLAVLAAAGTGFAVGAVWYGILGKAWMVAAALSPDEVKPSAGPFLTAIVANLVMAYLLAGAIAHMGEVTVRAGVITASLLWLGFVVTTMAVNHAFQGASRMLTAINGGHWLAVLVAMGVVIGLFG